LSITFIYFSVPPVYFGLALSYVCGGVVWRQYESTVVCLLIVTHYFNYSAGICIAVHCWWMTI